MIVVRRGVTRTVILTRRYAIKVPSLRGAVTGGVRGRLCSLAAGILANEAEHAWSRYGGWKGPVAPVLHSWLGGMVQVYPRCEPYECSPELEISMHERRWRPQELGPAPADEKPDNYGWLTVDGERRLVRVDYDMR